LGWRAAAGNRDWVAGTAENDNEAVGGAGHHSFEFVRFDNWSCGSAGCCTGGSGLPALSGTITDDVEEREP